MVEEAVRLRSDMKVLLMSGYADEASKSGFLHPGLHFNRKTFTSNALALKIRECSIIPRVNNLHARPCKHRIIGR